MSEKVKERAFLKHPKMKIKKIMMEKRRGGIVLNKKLKKELQFLYRAPEPVEKNAFLRRIRTPGMSYPEFLRSQLGYIKKWNWALAAAVFACGICMGVSAQASVRLLVVNMLTVLFSLLALSAAAEGSRAVRFGMEELELTARFSRKAVLMAKFTILGLEDLALFAMIFPIMTGTGQYAVITTSVTILFPYLFTCFWSLVILRHIRGRESVYYCGCAAAGSCLLVLLYGKFRFLHLLSPEIWALVILALAAAVAAEIRKTLCQSEELIWNLS